MAAYVREKVSTTAIIGSYRVNKVLVESVTKFTNTRSNLVKHDRLFASIYKLLTSKNVSRLLERTYRAL